MRYVLLTAAFTCLISTRAVAQQPEAEPWLRDRGAGLPTSMFGTFIQKGELIVYPFFEAYVAWQWSSRSRASPPRLTRRPAICRHCRRASRIAGVAALLAIEYREEPEMRGFSVRADRHRTDRPGQRRRGAADQGHGDAIEEQFKIWNFTEAEKEGWRRSGRSKPEISPGARETTRVASCREGMPMAAGSRRRSLRVAPRARR